MARIILAVFCVVLAGCNTGDQQPTAIQTYPTQLPLVQKSDYLADGMESMPVVWNGQLLSIVSRRGWTVYTGTTTVTIYDGQIALTTVPAPGFAFISALVDNGTLYVFGTVTNSTIQMVSTTDLYNWTAPVVVMTAEPDQHFYNTSVAKDATGFVMAYETDEFSPYTIRFARSSDLTTWSPAGSVFHPESYAACPTIRYRNGYYYVFYLKSQPPYFYIYAERSPDLVSWEPQSNSAVLLFPEASEGINASDMDMVEYHGTVEMLYLDGDQSTWGALKKATYAGSFDQMVAALFYS